uniref:Uncharacterized protein n=1 Tax=Meloidogyne incognita TaxID=6306 RepID=A0A914LCM1_MELIC
MEQGKHTKPPSIFETCPSKVSRIKTQSTMFYVSSTAANKMNTFRSNLTSQFVLTLLMNWITLPSSFASFMPIVLRNTHIFRLFKTYLTD